MNMKLFTILSVAIALVSALTFVNLYKKSLRSPSLPATEQTAMVVSPNVYSAPNPNATTGDASVKAMVKIGAPDDVTASVTIE